MADTNNTSMQSKRSPALWISLIVVAVIVLVGVVYYSQSADTEGNENSNGNLNTALNTNAATNSNTNSGVDTSNWKSYENTKYGYHFKYPNDWKLEGDPSSLTPDPQAEVVRFGGVSGSFQVELPTISPNSCDSLSSCVSKYPQHKQDGDSSSGLREILIGGLNGMTETITRPSATPAPAVIHAYYLMHRDNFIRFSTLSASNMDTQAIPIYGAIVSSFQFTQ